MAPVCAGVLVCCLILEWICSASVCWSASCASILELMCGAIVGWSASFALMLEWICGASVGWSASSLLDFGIDLWRQCTGVLVLP